MYSFFKRETRINLPGPKPWPIMGSTFNIDQNKPHLTFDKWHQEYNKDFMYYHKSQQVVVVGSADAMHEALVKKGADFMGRFSTYRLKMWTNFSEEFQDGITFSKPDATWKMLRQSTHKNLKQYDGGRERVELVATEVRPHKIHIPFLRQCRTAHTPDIFQG